MLHNVMPLHIFLCVIQCIIAVPYAPCDFPKIDMTSYVVIYNQLMNTK